MRVVAVITDLNKAFSAPRICTVDAGYFAKFVKLPALEISLAPTYHNKSIVQMLNIAAVTLHVTAAMLFIRNMA